MTYQVSVQFKEKSALVFNRNEDSEEIQIGKTYKFSMMISQAKLVFLTEEGETICPQEEKGKVTVFKQKRGQTQKKQILVISSSSKNCSQQLQQVIGTNRKYKSCLSFIPSKVKHISILSGESETQKYRGFMNLIGIMFVILNLRNIIDNFIKYGIQFGTTPTDFIEVHTIGAGFGAMFFPMMLYFIEKIRFNKYMSQKICNFLEYIVIFGILVYNFRYCQLYQPLPLNAVLFTMMCIIMCLKSISFVQVNNELFTIIEKLKQIKSKRNQNKKVYAQMFSQFQINEQNLELILKYQASWENIVSLQKLVYFMCAPTLCYQLQYPRTSSIRKIWLLKRCIQFLIITSLQIILWFQYIEPELRKILVMRNENTYTWIELFHEFMRLAIPNTIMWITGFYNFFHLFLNISSQILRFSDRKFYLDWWNCRNLEEYWKTWNLPVHFWFIRHVYNPILQKGVPKVLANILVFLISAIAHEYAVGVPLGILSYWAFLGMLSQAPVIIIQKQIDKILHLGDSELGNVSFWLFFCLLGQPIIVSIYYDLYMKKVALENVQDWIPNVIASEL